MRALEREREREEPFSLQRKRGGREEESAERSRKRKQETSENFFFDNFILTFFKEKGFVFFFIDIGYQQGILFFKRLGGGNLQQ